MWEFIKGIGIRISNLVAIKKMFYVHPDIYVWGVVQGYKVLASFELGSGHWLVIAKASTKGHGGNEGLSDCRLRITAKEGERNDSDESYESPAASLGSTVMVMLPFKITSWAQFELEAATQLAPAEFVKIKLVAIRDPNS